MNDGITFLRCLLMYLIVLHHTICHTRLSCNGWMFVLFLFTVPAVDGFLSISGWFGVRFSWRKVCSLAGQVLFYGILGSAVSCFAASRGWIERPMISTGNAWYVVAYIALVLMSPIINDGLASLRGRNALRLALQVSLALLTMDYLSRWFGLGFSVNGFGSHTFATFLLVYIVTWALRRSDATPMVGLGSLILYIVVFSVVRYLKPGASCVDVVKVSGFYNCPLVVASGFALVALFSRIQVGAGVARFLRFISPSMLAVYLIHDASPIGKRLLITGPGDHLNAVAAIPWSIAVYFSAVLLDLIVRRFPLWLVEKSVERSRNGR